jgi:hypothetical protein
MSYDPPSYVVNFAETRKLPFKVAIDNTGSVAQAWGDVKLTPTTYLVNKQGEIVKRYVGEPDFRRAAQADREAARRGLKLPFARGNKKGATGSAFCFWKGACGAGIVFLPLLLVAEAVVAGLAARAVGPNWAFSASMLPALAAATSLPVSSISFCWRSLNLASSFQTSGLALPPSVPAPKPAQGSLAMSATTSHWLRQPLRRRERGRWPWRPGGRNAGHHEQRALAVLDGVLGLGELGRSGQGHRSAGGCKGERGKSDHRGSLCGVATPSNAGAAAECRGRPCRRHSNNPKQPSARTLLICAFRSLAPPRPHR